MDAGKGRKIARIGLITIFLSVLCLEFIGTVLSDKKEISLIEKRNLASLPSFQLTWKSLETYPETFEKFWNDHFLFRKQMVAMNSWLRIRLFHRSPTFMALPGSCSWCYMVGDWALQDYLGTIHMTQEGLACWKHVIAQRRQWVSTWGGHYLLAVAPNKMMVYPEYLPYRLQQNRGTTMLDALNSYLSDSPLRENVLDLRPVMQRAKLKRQVYYKTDTHWDSYGAYQAYREIIRRIRKWYPEVEPVSPVRLQVGMEFAKSGDLALLMGLLGILEENVEDWTVQSPCAGSTEQPVPLSFLRKEQYPARNGCRQGVHLRVLVISDSFGVALHQYLSETFQEVVYDSSIEFNDFEQFMADYRPDIVLHLHVARFMERAFVLDPDLDNLVSGTAVK